MAKNDNDYETPIQFETPKWGTRGSRVPTPINQPNWVYKHKANSKSPISKTTGILILLIIPAALSILLISESMYNPSLWLFVILFIAGAVLYALNTTNGSNKDDAQNTGDSNLDKPKKKAKKVRKQRKDYK